MKTRTINKEAEMSLSIKLGKEEISLLDLISIKNDIRYSHSKLVEELFELGVELSHALNKPEKAKRDDLAAELADVYLRMEILIRRLQIAPEVQECVSKKIQKYSKYLDSEKYANI